MVDGFMAQLQSLIGAFLPDQDTQFLRSVHTEFVTSFLHQADQGAGIRARVLTKLQPSPLGSEIQFRDPNGFRFLA